MSTLWQRIDAEKREAFRLWREGFACGLQAGGLLLAVLLCVLAVGERDGFVLSTGTTILLCAAAYWLGKRKRR